MGSVVKSALPIATGAADVVEGSLLGGDAARAAEGAAETQAAAQQEALDYLKETEALPQAMREAALTQIGGMYGIGFDPATGEYTDIEPVGGFDQAQLIEQAEASPLYQSIMGGQAAGEEALARTASATGGLRGGGTASQLAGFGKDLQNEALLQSYGAEVSQYNQNLAGLQGLANLPSQATSIAGMTAGIGQTQAQGQIASANARQQAMNQLMGLGGQAGAAAISDERLKDDITKIGSTSNDHIDKYIWCWRPESGKQGYETGYLAQEVEKVYPDLVIEGSDGYKRIFKGKLEDRLNG